MTELDFWVGSETAERYRRSRRRGTRAPLDVVDQARCYIVFAVAVYVSCAGAGALVRTTSFGLRAVVGVAIAALVWVGAAAIRYVRLPVADEFPDP